MRRQQMDRGYGDDRSPGVRNTVRRQFTAGMHEYGEWCVAQAPEVDIASRGKSVEDALDSLREAFTFISNRRPTGSRRSADAP